MDGGAARDVALGEAATAGRPAAHAEYGGPCGGPEGAACRAGAAPGRPAGLGARLLEAAARKETLAVLDQAVVSGTSFLTTVLIGRWCGAGELGVYSLGFTLLVSWACVQESLIGLPYTIYCHRPQRQAPAEHAGSALVHQALLSALTLVVLAAGAALLSLQGAVQGLAAVIWVLAGAMPFALLREFGRRFAFAHLRMAEALLLDVAVAAVQLAGLAWLASTGALSAITAYAALGAACALTGAVWLYLARGNFVVRWAQVRPTLRQSWSLGKWFFASQLTLSAQGYFTHWLLAWVVGATATGVYAACMTVVLFSNPLTLGISNALAPRAARAYAQGGGGELRGVVSRTALLLGVAMALFCAAVLLGGDDLLGLLYRGPQYAGHGHAVAVLALAMLAAALGMPASNGLAAVERPDVVFKVGLYALGLSVVLVPCLVAGWGVTGAAYGFLAGNVAGSLGRWLAFSALVLKRGSPSAAAPVLRVLQQFTQTPRDDGWVIELLNEGAQASVFAVRTHDRRPVWHGYADLVVKLYKPDTRQRLELLRAQFASMSRFHARLDGATINGWKVHAPAPLYQCELPFALVMTLVPGRSLNACLETAGQVPPEALGPIAEAVIAGMERFWSSDSQFHGDLNFDNVLCDPAARSLSFVDPGVVEHACLCDGAARQWFPASRDLAHMLYETGVSVKRTLGKPRARRLQRRLVEAVLRAFMERVGGADQRGRLLDEIHACVEIHLRSLKLSWSARGAWRAVVRRTAARRIAAILGNLRADTAGAGDGPARAQKGRD